MFQHAAREPSDRAEILLKTIATSTDCGYRLVLFFMFYLFVFASYHRRFIYALRIPLSNGVRVFPPEAGMILLAASLSRLIYVISGRALTYVKHEKTLCAVNSPVAAYVDVGMWDS